MKFVEKHLTRHHLFNAPHKWFFALISSPIHFAELHYKNKYHLTYAHAKKLFIFDMALLASVFILVGTIIFWFTFDPKVVDDVQLFIHAQKEKVASGEYVTYSISYKNNSDSFLLSPSITIIHPNGFLIDSWKPEKYFDEKSNSFVLSDMYPGSEGVLTVSGYFYEQPEADKRIRARLTYTQEKRKTHEYKESATITTLRGSIIKSNLIIPSKIIADSVIPFSLSIETPFHKNIQEISIPLNFGFFHLTSNEIPTLGVIKDNIWHIPFDKANKTGNIINAKIIGELTTTIPKERNTTIYSITPIIKVKEENIQQEKNEQTIQIVHPNMDINIEFENNTVISHPGEEIIMNINIQNNGTIALNNIQINIPTPESIINTFILQQKNLGILSQNIFTINQKHTAELQKIEPGQSKKIKVIIPIKNTISQDTISQEKDLVLLFNPTIEAEVDGIENSVFKKNTSTPQIKIGTKMWFDASIRYYTVDGDQLGRGPLPPTVGKQTTYWLLIQLNNTTSDVKNIQLNAKLSKNTLWLNKSSVSHGDSVKFDEKTNSAIWNLPTLESHSSAGIYIAFGFTPSLADIGSTPALLENISISGYDTHIQEDIRLDMSEGLDISLLKDEQARKNGVKVQ